MVLPPSLRALATDEFAPPPPSAMTRAAQARAAEVIDGVVGDNGPRQRELARSRRGTAIALRAVDPAGEFYAVPEDATRDEEVARATFDGPERVVDVQTHLVRPSRAQTRAAAALFGFLRMVDPQRWTTVDPGALSAAAWATNVFGLSETEVALVTSPPGPGDTNVVSNEDIAATREIVDRYAGSGRVLTHAIVHPNLGAPEHDRMVGWSEELRPAGWKVYTLWEPPEHPDGGWFLDDERVGVPFLEHVRDIGPRIVCAHKGLAGPVASQAPAAASPRDIGPAAARFPELTFIVYHSGYDLDPEPEADHARDPHRGVSRLVSSLEESGIGPGGNVYAELGSTWYLVHRDPLQAAHVVGKLLAALGPERILWGTDSVWYGSPQFLIDAFRAFSIPAWMQDRFGYPALDGAAKRAILEDNARRLYALDAPAEPAGDAAWVDGARAELLARLA